VLQKHYANLQALALDKDAVEEVPDYLIPDLQGMLKFEDSILDFRNSVLPEDYDEQLYSKKRKRGDGEDGTPRPKREAIDINDPSLDWNNLAQSGKLSNLTIPQLKVYLSSQSLKFSSKAKKQDLIDIITQHLQS